MGITKRKKTLLATVLGILLGIWVIDSLSTVENFIKGCESVRNAPP